MKLNSIEICPLTLHFLQNLMGNRMYIWNPLSSLVWHLVYQETLREMRSEIN